MKSNRNFWLVILAAISLVYILLRFWHLSDSCLWFDEIFSIHAAEHDWRNLFWFVAQDLIHPPLFYALLKIWISIGGESLFWLRVFPGFFAAIAIIPFILLCRQLKLSLPVIALALTFFAVNGSLIKYAQEVRMYCLLLCFGLFSMWLFVRFLNWGKGFSILIIVNILLVYSHYFGWLIVASEVLAVIVLARERLKQIFPMSILTLLNFAPWLYAVWQATKINSNVGQNIGWMNKPNLLTLLQFVFDLFQPIYFEQSNSARNKPEQILMAMITLIILAAGTIAFGFYFADWKKESADEKRNLFLLLIFLFAPLLLAFTTSWILPYSIWGTRHLIIAFAPLAILTAIAFSKIRFWQLRAASLSAVFLLFIVSFVFQTMRDEPKYIWCAWENLAQNVEANQPTKIYVFEDLVAYHFWFAERENENAQVLKINNLDGISEDKAYFLPRGFDAAKIADFDSISGDEFYIAFRARDWDLTKPPLRNLIEKGYKIGEPKVFEAQGFKAFLVEVSK